MICDVVSFDCYIHHGVGQTHPSRFGNDFEDGAPAIGEDRDAPTDGDPPDNPGGDGDMEILDDDDFGGFDE